jgi:hypothetical protein
MRVVASHFSLRDVNFDLLSFILHTKQYYNNSYRWDPFSFHEPLRIHSPTPKAARSDPPYTDPPSSTASRSSSQSQ